MYRLLKGHVTQLSAEDLRTWSFTTSRRVQGNISKEVFAQLAFAMTTGHADDPDEILQSYEYRDNDADRTGSSNEIQPEPYREQVLNGFLTAILNTVQAPLTALNTI